jgi:hypothetical protein
MKGGEENMKTNKSTLIIGILVAIIVAIVAFFGGVKYQQMQAAKNPGNMMFGAQGQRGQFIQRFGKGGGPGGFPGGGAVMGQIVSADADSITVKMKDGSSKIVNLSSSTKISKTDTASSSDLKTGQTVAVFGTTNSDGSVSAEKIQLNPQTMMKKVSPTPIQ